MPRRLKQSGASVATPETTANPIAGNTASALTRLARIPGALKRPIPHEVSPELATLSGSPPDGEEWLHEIKFDGYRLVCRLDHSNVQLLTRNHLDWSERIPSLVETLQNLSSKQAIFDGEVVILDEEGKSSYQQLQNAFFEAGTDSFHYYAFDLLYLDGHDLLQVPLEERRQQLKLLLESQNSDQVRFSKHFEGNAQEFFCECARLGLEGMISKRRDSQYTQGRSMDWVKTKCVHRDEFVIGGYDKLSAVRQTAILFLGRYDEHGSLVYVGSVRDGFSDAALYELERRLPALQQSKSSFKEIPHGLQGVRHVRPSLVCQIEFDDWTKHEQLAKPIFQGLREDLESSSVTSHKPTELNHSRAGSAPEGRSPSSARRMETVDHGVQPSNDKRSTTMTKKATIKRAKELAEEGKSPSTQAGEFIKETLDEIREGSIGARSTKQAIAIGLSKARRAGVDLPPPKKGKTSEETRKNAEHAYQAGQADPDHEVNQKRSKATIKALQREGHEAASHEALSKQAKSQAKKRTAAERSASARKAAKTRKR